MEQKWIGIGIGHGGAEVQRALEAEGFKCSRQGLPGPTELKVLIRTTSADREHVSGTPTHHFPGYRNS